MTLKEKISVNTHYTRSINLERDAASAEIIRSYIPTSRALRTLAKVADTFDQKDTPRAWSLVGPYGSGKSSFSLFISQLLSSSEDSNTKIAYEVLADSETQLAKKYSNALKNSAGYLKILLTGAPEPLTTRIVKALSEAAANFWDKRKGKKPRILASLRELAVQKDISITEVLDRLVELQAQLAYTGCSGILLVIDELGKFLEYEARHYGANEIYLLQKLAEHGQKHNKVNLLLFVLLHQSFEQYAKGLGDNLKSEWSKIQGRFEEVPFLESTEQVLRVVSTAVEQNLTATEKKKIATNIRHISNVLSKEEALPGALLEKDAIKLFADCYPFHPVSAILLPTLCQKIAQNERTLFSYLGSHEEFGFHDLLTKLSHCGDYIYPHHIYDYFVANQTAALGDYLTHRRWVEVVTAIERLGDTKEQEIILLKTIGILNIVGSKGGFKASKAVLEQCLPDGKKLTSVVKALGDKSVINFRRFNNEYRVWQGSDFDLEGALQEELNNFGNFSLADELNQAKTLMPVVARRYTIQNGALRYFVPIFVDAQNYSSILHQDSEARIIIFLAGGQDDVDIYYSKVNKHFSALDISVLCLNAPQLREAVAETLALKQVIINHQELNSDPIAKREIEDRLTAAEQEEDRLLLDLLDSPEQNQWFNAGNPLNVTSKRQLQEVLSDVLESVYSKAPEIRNELINRDTPSSQANAARNKLLFAMLNHPEKEDLAIDKFPPEKAIYRSLLRATGLHKTVEDFSNVWGFSEPEHDGRSDTKKMRFVWQRINEFLDSTEQEAKSFAELNDDLMAPPFGIKAGVLPILYFSVYMVYRHELAFYEERRYLPEYTLEQIERFVKRPDLFTVQRFRIKGLRASIYEQYQKALFSDNKKRTVIELIQPLAKFINTLPKFTLNTKSTTYLSKNAIAVREAFEFASSPEKLLFADLPTALGFNGTHAKNLGEFSEALRQSVTQLKHAYQKMLDSNLGMICEAFELKKGSLNEIRRKFAWYAELENFTIDKDGLRAFLNRLTDPQGDDPQWLESVLSFLGQLPTVQWTDATCSEVDFKLADYSRRVLDLHKLYIAYGTNKRADRQDIGVYLLKSVRLGGESLEEVVTVDNEHRKAIASIKEKLWQALEGTTGGSLQKAALAAFVDEFLADKKAQAEQTHKKTKKKSRKQGG